MTHMENLLSGPVAHVVGWCLVHFVWQGLLVACALACVLALMRRRSANARYVVAYSALLLMAALPIATTLALAHSAHGIAVPPKAIAGRAAHVQASNSVPEKSGPFAGYSSERLASWLSSSASWRTPLAASLEPWLPWAVRLWLAGVLALALWNLGGWFQARRFMSRDVTDVSEFWSLTARRVCENLGVRRPVRLLESALAATPIVAGVLRPVILFPAAVLTGLTTDQAQAVLAHELAHVRRHDYAANLLQTAIVTLLFYHPAVWWVSRRIRDERENCCDDLAVQACGDPMLYARALSALAEFRDVPAALVMAARGGVLLKRIRRIVGAPEPRAHGLAPLMAGAFLLMIVVCAALASPAVRAEADSVAAEKAELMGRVENIFLHNYRDITARKSLEWGDVERQDNGNRSIRYMYRATIWDKDVMIMNYIYTFDPQGKCFSEVSVAGYPKKEEKKIPDITTKQGMMNLVEDFFSNNYRDITARETIEWGDVEKLPGGNASIRYKFNATIWDKDKKVMEQVFTFNPKGEFVSVKDAAAPSGNGAASSPVPAAPPAADGKP